MVFDRSLFNSPRHLTLQHAQKVKINNSHNTDDKDKDAAGALWTKLRPLVEGREMLYSHFSPTLAGGIHSVETTQKVDANSQLLSKTTTKEFHVEAPQYVLPEGAVHSCFPPSGSTAHTEILPHVLFPDPYLPWERLADSEGDNRNRVPWLALLVFSEDELRLDEKLLNGNESLFKTTSLPVESQATGKPLQQRPTFSLNLLVSDLTKIEKSLTPVPASDDASARTDIILIKPHLFDLLTTEYENDGTPKNDQTKASVSRYQYLAHVRHSKASGMNATGDAEGLFSVVHSHRIGPLSDDRSSRAIVHLVSLEGWHKVERTHLLEGQKPEFVVLSSLYSWTYTTMPAGAMNVSESFRHIGAGLNLLRSPDGLLAKIKEDASPQAKRIHGRLKDGYTLTIYHTQTGEETAAISRGALTPTIPPKKLSEQWTSLSFSGSDLQIFDEQAGLMDITYSTAWSLGKALALADGTFTTSLSRLRSITETFALEYAKKKKATLAGAWKSRDSTFRSLPDSILNLNLLARGELGVPPPSNANGLLSISDEAAIDLSRGDNSIIAGINDAATDKIRHFAGSKDAEGQDFFNELNTPNSTDWMIVLSWVLDKMFLFGVPAQYLVIDPSWLPDESLRFFYIDPHWVEALIDGALSIANHMDQQDDSLRRILKGAFNAYFKTVDPVLNYRPQIPTYGFLLRSDLVKNFPDLHVTAPIPANSTEPDRAPILRQDKLADDVMFCLVDRAPGANDLHTLSFTQPAHQQFFVIGDEVSTKQLETSYKRVYTKPPPDGRPYEYKSIEKRELKSQPDPPPLPSEDPTVPPPPPSPPALPRLFIWGDKSEARFLNLPAYASDVLSVLKSDLVSSFDDNVATSALVGFQLGCPVYQLSLMSEHLTGLETHNDPRLFRMLKARQPRLLPSSGPLFENAAALYPAEDSDELSVVKLEMISSPPPHFPSLLISARALKAESLSAHDEAEGPEFRFHVYPIDAYKRPIPSMSKYPQDLVFSIKLVSGENYDYDLTQIKVTVPMGEKKNSHNTANLLAKYEGPGPVMLTNLRFNVVLSVGSDSLDFTLLPRSTSGKVALTRLRDCSFLLPLVTVNDYDDGTYHPNLQHRESYVQGPDHGGSTSLTLEP